MESNDPTGFFPEPFGRLKLCRGYFRVAVDAGHIKPLFRFHRFLHRWAAVLRPEADLPAYA